MQNQFSFLPKIAALTVMAACAAPVMAQQAGDNVIGVGWFHLTPQDSSEGLTGTGGAVNGVSRPNSHSSVSNADTLGLAFTHFFTDNVALTLDAGIPPKFRLSGQGDLAGLGQLGSAKQWSPALVAKYYFGTPESTFRPFLGAGVTYVWYSDVSLTPQFQSAAAGASINPALAGGTATASLSSSWAPVISAGANYNFNKNWSLGFSVSYIKLKTDADITATPTATGRAVLGSAPLRYRTSITLDPIVTFLSLNYKF